MKIYLIGLPSSKILFSTKLFFSWSLTSEFDLKRKKNNGVFLIYPNVLFSENTNA